MEQERLQLNIRGSRCEISVETFNKLKRLSTKTEEIFLKQQKGGQDEYFIDCSPGIFHSILNFVQGRSLHLPSNACVGELIEELEFWGINQSQISKCCLSKVITFQDDEKALKILEKDQEKKVNEKDKLMCLVDGKHSWKKVQARGWLILEEPRTSLTAKIYFFTSAALVLASIFGLVCQTHPYFRRSLRVSEWQEYFGEEWEAYKGHFDGSYMSNTTLPPLPKMVSTKMDFLYYIEYITVAYFTIELGIRLVLYPFGFKLFFFDFLNLVDIFSLVVMYSIYFVNLANPKDKYENSIADIIHCLQIIRIFRLFRLVKNFSGFRVLMYAVKASAFEVLLMSMFLVVAMLMFGAFVFFSGDTEFPSIPDSFWWAIVTMTTVGYGDMVPRIGLSKVIGAFCAITGVCLLAVIIPIFVNNFVLFYNYSKVWKTQSKTDEKASQNRKHSISVVKIQPADT